MTDWDLFWSSALPEGRSHHLIRRVYEHGIVDACIRMGMERHAALAVARDASQAYATVFKASPTGELVRKEFSHV